MSADLQLAMSVPLPADEMDRCCDDGLILSRTVTTALEHLPDPVLSYLLQFAIDDLRGWENVQLVSKRFLCFSNVVALTIPEPEMRWVSLNRLKGLQRLQLHAWKDVLLNALLHQLDLRHLKTLTLCWAWTISDDSLAVLATLPKLRSLTILGAEIGLPRQLARMHLTALDLSNVSIGDEGTELLALCTDLVTFSAYDCDVSDRCVFALSRNQNFRSLSLRCREYYDDPKVTNVSVTYIGCMRNLTSLELVNYKQITNEGIAALASLVHLVLLNLSGCNLISNAGLESLSSLTTMRRLYLQGSDMRLGVDDDGLPTLAGLTALKVLDVYYCDITGSGFASLTALTALTALDCGRCPI